MLYSLPLVVLVAQALFSFASAAIIDTTLPAGVTSTNCVNYPVFSRCWSDTKNHVEACGEDKNCQCQQANYFLICFLQCESPGQPANSALAPYQTSILTSLKPVCPSFTSAINNAVNGNNNGQVNGAASIPPTGSSTLPVSPGSSVATPISTVKPATSTLPLTTTTSTSLMTTMTPNPTSTLPLNSTTSTSSHIKTLPTTKLSSDASTISVPPSMFMSSFLAMVTYILQAIAMA